MHVLKKLFCLTHVANIILIIRFTYFFFKKVHRSVKVHLHDIHVVRSSTLILRSVSSKFMNHTSIPKGNPIIISTRSGLHLFYSSIFFYIHLFFNFYPSVEDVWCILYIYILFYYYYYLNFRIEKKSTLRHISIISF